MWSGCGVGCRKVKQCFKCQGNGLQPHCIRHAEQARCPYIETEDEEEQWVQPKRGSKEDVDYVDATQAVIKESSIQTIPHLLEAFPPATANMYETLKTGSVLGKSETYLTNFKTYIGEIVMKVCSLYSSSKQKLYNKVLGKFTGSDASTMKVKKAKDTFKVALASTKNNKEIYWTCQSIAFIIIDGGNFDPNEHPACAKIGRHAQDSVGTDFANLANSGSIEPANKIRTLE
jgi:hypothetical protein